MKKAKIFVGPPNSGKTRKALEIIENYDGKSVFLSGRSMVDRNGIFNNFSLSHINEDTDIVVIDDVPEYFQFMQLAEFISNRPTNVRIDIPYKRSKYIDTSNIQFIITTIHDIESPESSFDNRFEIIQFPLPQ